MERINKEKKEAIMDKLEKASSEEYETSWDEHGAPKSKKKSEIKKGKASRAKGTRFELKVRKDLESKGRIVDKWSNNVDIEKGKIIPAKRKYNPFKKAMVIGTGFPDFISFKKISEGSYSIVGVEVKINGTLSKEEKEKCAWYLQKGIFSEIWIARDEKSSVAYEDFKEKYGDKYNKT